MALHSTVALTLVACALSLIGGCASVSAYRTPGSENVQIDNLAVLENDGYDSGFSVVISAVDGKQTEDFRRLELEPGRRTVTVQLKKLFSEPSRPVTLSFLAQAGDVYEIQYEVRPRMWRVMIVDKRTGRPVSSESRDPPPRENANVSGSQA